MTLNGFIDKLRQQFKEPELNYYSVHKATIRVQMVNVTNGEIHIHELDYKAKTAINLMIGGNNGTSQVSNSN